MNKDRVEGKMKDVAGRVERQAGEWTGNEKMQVHGTAKQAEGKVQNTVGKLEDAANAAVKHTDDVEDQELNESEAARKRRDPAA